ncbi:4-alpha-glucanotransferase [Saccharobesus litoralis]|uniref:4-alpha-glucanotransferase n=1 Tax=Saccharobesus litoralis TaxID=2172099 RepID=A0A2S0VU35_9ALTE|nr:4-alpha-glucanotransferase [Saccharobesus litoralis]AWB67693.1 4-alpha-glucanotransferase [Saccharobesus litoralis]
MNNELIEQLAQARGVESKYVDAWGNDANVDPSVKVKLLSGMGYPVEDDIALQEAIEGETQDTWSTPLNPVNIIRNTEDVSIELRLPIHVVNNEFSWEITQEDGISQSGTILPINGNLINVAQIDGLEFQEYLITLDISLPLGYHTLSIINAEADIQAQQNLIIAPKACYKQQPIADGKKVWGPSVQLYCIRTESNWGIGDFGDLSTLIKEVASRGAEFVGLNPIHALYPANADSCSPYSPSSRRWLNSLYVDVTQVEGYQSEAVQALVNSSEFQAKLHSARQAEWVDYQAVTEMKHAALKLTFEWFKANGDKSAFKQFVESGGESLQQIAIFDAVQETIAAKGTIAWGWPAWPEDLNEYHKPAVAEFAQNNADLVEYYCYLQWISDVQINQCQQHALDAGMTIGIYRDLAVGVSEGSAEIWANSDLYCTEASVGAPPDVLGPQGQNWGLPPMDPEKLFAQSYAPIIELFRSNMRACGALRIDHAMALLRLWWVPKGDSAKEGAYVYYPVDDLLALLALESHRNQCLVIGEDLGTVPDGIPELLAENGVHSYRVFFFEVAPDGGFFSPSHYPVQAMATLTTHDMPTLRGYWHCDDLNLGKEVGVYPDEDVRQSLFASRHRDKQAILDTLHGHGSIPHSVPRNVEYTEMTQELNFGMQIHMAKGSSALLSLQLEDWMQMDKPVNIPGTSTEYPNWRRKLSMNLSDLFAKHEVNDLTQRLTQAREQATK